MLRPVIGPLAFIRRDMGIESAIKELTAAFPDLKLFDGRSDNLLTPATSPKSTPSSARSTASSSVNESTSSGSLDSARITRIGSEQSTSSTTAQL